MNYADLKKNDSKLYGVLTDANNVCHVLLANGRSDYKMKLGISNQEYEGYKGEAISMVMNNALVVEAAKRVIYNGAYSSKGLQTEFETMINTLAEKAGAEKTEVTE